MVAGLGLETVNFRVVEVVGDTLVLHAVETVNLGLLAVEMPGVFEIGFNKRPEVFGSLGEDFGRKGMPVVIGSAEPVVKLDAVV